MMNDLEPLTEGTIEREIANLTSEDLARIHKAAQRWRAQLLCLWKLCPKAACRKAQACSADPDFCIERFALLISEEVRDAVDTLHEGKLLGRSYDEARAMGDAVSMEAYDLWLENLHNPLSEQPKSQAREGA